MLTKVIEESINFDNNKLVSLILSIKYALIMHLFRIVDVNIFSINFIKVRKIEFEQTKTSDNLFKTFFGKRMQCKCIRNVFSDLFGQHIVLVLPSSIMCLLISSMARFG